MKIVRSIARMQSLASDLRRKGRSIGFVPTMGALHAGHLSLVRAARRQAETVVVSIFVNPTQFAPGEDFARYPRAPRRDAARARQAGVDILFCPTAAGMYPRGSATAVTVDGVSSGLCGASRPGHFTGVATVVTKLFNIVKPTAAYFGQKDAQQAAIIRRMAADLNMDIAVKVLPVVRESDGLAMSSRNRYLTAAERRDAAILYQALRRAGACIAAGERDPKKVVREMRAVLGACPAAKVEYIAVVSARSLQPLRRLSGEVLVALAARVGKTRLIDNITRKVPA